MKKLDVVQEREKAAASEMLKQGRKDKALYCLKRKKMHQVQVEKIAAMLDNVQQMLETLDFSAVEAQVMAALKDGTTALTAMNNAMKIEDVENLVDDAAEAVSISKEVGALLAENIGADDETEIEQELVEMAKQLKKSQGTDEKIDLGPRVPDHTIESQHGVAETTEQPTERVAA